MLNNYIYVLCVVCFKMYDVQCLMSSGIVSNRNMVIGLHNILFVDKIFASAPKRWDKFRIHLNLHVFCFVSSYSINWHYNKRDNVIGLAKQRGMQFLTSWMHLMWKCYGRDPSKRISANLCPVTSIYAEMSIVTCVLRIWISLVVVPEGNHIVEIHYVQIKNHYCSIYTWAIMKCKVHNEK